MRGCTVFLSSTFADFAAERRRLLDVLAYIDVHVICTERAGDRGKSVSETLREQIDRCDIVVLLLGSRSGTPSDTGEPWTEKEFNYAFSKGKRVFAYLRVAPMESTLFVDQDGAAAERLDDFLKKVHSRIAVVPRYGLGECCRLTAMVIRDVDRHSQELKLKEQRSNYDDSFVT